MKLIWVLIAMAGVLCHVSHRHLDQIERPQGSIEETLPSKKALEMLAMSYDSLVADYFWLRSLNAFGTTQEHYAGYPNLIPLVDRTLALDKYFAAAYKFAGTALTVNNLDPTHSVRMLKQGMIHRPDVWQVPYYLGFNLYYFLKDYDAAAKALLAASKLEGAPPNAALLAIRLTAESSQPLVGLEMVDSILRGIGKEEEGEDEGTKQLRIDYQDRRKRLMLDIELMWARRATEQSPATDVASFAVALRALLATDPDFQLVQQKGAFHLFPNDPFGDPYIFADGAISSSNSHKLLRLHMSQRAQKRSDRQQEALEKEANRERSRATDQPEKKP